MDPDSNRRQAAPTDILVPDILVTDPRWRRLVPRAERLARRAAREAGGAGSIVLAGNAAVQRLNARHRRRNKPTNVLTFDGGDLVLAFGVVAREAREAKRPAAHHLAHLVVHGCLHLAGQDHAAAGAARRMELAEARILHRLGVPNPWKPRP